MSVFFKIFLLLIFKWFVGLFNMRKLLFFIDNFVNSKCVCLLFDSIEIDFLILLFEKRKVFKWFLILIFGVVEKVFYNLFKIVFVFVKLF